MRLDDALEDYLLACRGRKNSVHTDMWYRQKLGVFLDWARGRGLDTLEALTPRDVREFLIATSSRIGGHHVGTITSHTQHGYAQVMRSFLRHCDANELGLSSPRLTRVEMPRVTVKVIHTFTDEQLKSLFGATKATRLPRRNLAIVETLLDTGVRVSELCGLRLDAVHADFLDIVGKGRRERQVPLGGKAGVDVLRYVRLERARQLAREVDQLFLSEEGSPLTRRGVHLLLLRLKDKAGITDVRVSAHTFRHTYAARAYKGGMDVYTLSRVLGHSTVTTTEKYLRSLTSTDARKRAFSVLDAL